LKTTIGLGFDVHPLKKGIPLFLGGIEIPFRKGLVGHSDGDCLIHAIIDALLGAVGDQDIGQLFPDTEKRFFNVRSTELLKHVAEILSKKNAEILHIDSIVVAEEPKLTPFIASMKETICPLLGLSVNSLGIKAKTCEKMGVVGKGKAISALATALVSLPE